MYERIYRLYHKVGTGTKGESFTWADKNTFFNDQGWEVFHTEQHAPKVDDLTRINAKKRA